MRRLGNLYIHFKASIRESEDMQTDVSITSEEMLNRRNFHHLETALERCTLLDDNNLKATLKVAYLFLLKRFSKITKAKFLTQGKDNEAVEIGRFVEVLELN